MNRTFDATGNTSGIGGTAVAAGGLLEDEELDDLDVPDEGADGFEVVDVVCPDAGAASRAALSAATVANPRQRCAVSAIAALL